MSFFKEKIGLSSTLIFALVLIFSTIKSSAAERSTKLWTDDRPNVYLNQICEDNQCSSDEKEVIKRAYNALIDVGWREDAANAVIELNIKDYAILADFDEEDIEAELNKQRGLFLTLGFDDDAQDFLTEHPNYATLLGLATSIKKGAPKYILETIPKDEEGQIIVESLYMLNASPEDACRIAELLHNKEFKTRIINLLKKSSFFIEYIDYFDFADKIFKEDPNVGEKYQQWLFRMIDLVLQGETPTEDADELSQIADSPNLKLDETSRRRLLLEINYALLREKLRDPEFRENFETRWDWYEEFLDSLDESEPEYDDKWLNCASDPRIWEMFQYYGKDVTFELYQHYGQYASAILLMPAFINPNQGQKGFKDAILAFMQSANDEEKLALVLANLPENQGYLDLLNLSTESSFISISLEQLALAEQGLDVRKRTSEELIEHWKSFKTPKALEAELADEKKKSSLTESIPFVSLYHSVWNLCRKFEDGREIGFGDCLEVAGAACDAVECGVAIVVILYTGGVAAPAATAAFAAKKGTKTALKYMVKTFKTVGKEVVDEGVERTLKTVGKEVVGEGAKSTTKTELKKLSKRELLELAHKTDRYLMRLCSNPNGSDVVDVTDLSRHAFVKKELSGYGLGVQSYRNATELDARFLTTKNGRFVATIKAFPDTRTGKILRKISEETARNVVIVGAVDSGQKIIRSANKKYEEWQINQSRWWLINGELSESRRKQSDDPTSDNF